MSSFILPLLSHVEICYCWSLPLPCNIFSHTSIWKILENNYRKVGRREKEMWNFGNTDSFYQDQPETKEEREHPPVVHLRIKLWLSTFALHSRMWCTTTNLRWIPSGLGLWKHMNFPAWPTLSAVKFACYSSKLIFLILSNFNWNGNQLTHWILRLL